MPATASGSLSEDAPDDTTAPPEPAASAPAIVTQAEVIAGLQAQIDALRQQPDRIRQQAPAPPPLPVLDSDPDIAGLPGIKPLRLTTPDRPRATTRHPLIYIDGEPVTIPDEIPQNIAAEYLHIAASTADPGLAQARAQDYLLTAVLGEDGYRRLREYPHLKAQQFAWVVETCQQLTVGALETQVPKG